MTGNEPIRHGLLCTKGQLLCLTLAYFVRHKLTKNRLTDLQSLLIVAVPDGMPQSKYYTEWYFFTPEVASNKKVHYYCPKCESYLGEVLDGHDSLNCSYCENDVALSKISNENGNFLHSKTVNDQSADLFFKV